MRDEGIQLHERILVEQQLDPFTRGELVAFVLLRDPLLAAAEPRFLAQPLEVRELVSRRHGASSALVVGPAGIEPATRRL